MMYSNSACFLSKDENFKESPSSGAFFGECSALVAKTLTEMVNKNIKKACITRGNYKKIVIMEERCVTFKFFSKKRERLPFF